MTEPTHQYLSLQDQDGNPVELRAYTFNDSEHGKVYGWWLGEPGGAGYPPQIPGGGGTVPPSSTTRATATLSSWNVIFDSLAAGPKLQLIVESDKTDVIQIFSGLKSSTGSYVAQFSVGSYQILPGTNTVEIIGQGYDINSVTETMIAELSFYGPQGNDGFLELFNGTKYVPRPAGRGFTYTFGGRVTSTNKVAEFSSPESLQVGDVVTLNAKWVTISNATIKLVPTGSNSGPSKSITATTSSPADGSVTYTVTQAGYLTGRITYGSGQALDFTMTMSFAS